MKWARSVNCLAWIAGLVFFVACGAQTLPPRVTPQPTPAEAEDAARETLAAILSEVNFDLAQARSLLVYLAGAPQVRNGSGSECSAFLQKQLQANPQYAQLGATTPNGVLFCDSVSRTRQVSVADRLYFSRAISARDFVVGEYVTGRITPLPSLGLAYPVQDDAKQLRGIVMAPLKLGWLAQRISEIDLPVTGEIVLLDTYGNILIRDPDANDWLGKNISDTELGKAMLGKIRGTGEFKGADGETRVYAYASPPASHDQLLVAVGIKK